MHMSRVDRPDVRVTMCRYRNGKLEGKLRSTRDTQYIAISHSWGNAMWQDLPGLEGPVWVSKTRAKFILNRLPLIVGDQYFWMDILCVDQHDERADFDVPKRISIIFRDAQRTVIIRDGAGFQKCCVQAAGNIDSWFNEAENTVRTRLSDHCRIAHKLDCLSEGVLSRLWVFQEVMLSDNIQFVKDDPVEFSNDNYYPNSGDTNIRRLDTMAMAWTNYVNGSMTNFPATHTSFISAFLNCGFASRPPVWKYRPHPLRKRLNEYIHKACPVDKMANGGTDYIHQNAMLLPPNSATLNIGDIFPHPSHYMAELSICTGQTSSFTGGDLACLRKPCFHWNIADQSYLSFMRARYGPRLLVHAEFANPPRPLSLSSSSDYHVSVKVALNLPLCDTLKHIHNSISRSAMIWRTAKDGELLVLRKGRAIFQNNRDKINIQAAISALWKLADNRLSAQFKNRVAEEVEVERAGTNAVVQLAAHISCGLGVHEFCWASQNLAPVLVTFKEKSFLSLVPVSVVSRKDEHKFTMAKSQKYSYGNTLCLFVLLAWDKTVEPETPMLCLFPPDIDVDDPEKWT
jgi:Heterokaryon incompatibility protein (HET)